MSAALPDWLARSALAGPGRIGRRAPWWNARCARANPAFASLPPCCLPPPRAAVGSPGPTRAGPDAAPFRTDHLALCPALSVQLLPGALHLLRLRRRPPDRAPQVDPGGTGSRAVRPETLGIEEILLLTGDRAAVADYPYVRDCVRLAAARFPNVAVEVFPMSVDEYRGLSAAGCTAVTLYQETYDPVRYEQSHLSGPKRDYLSRLDAPARALAGGMRAVAGLGALLGLGEPLFDLLGLFQHATHLRRAFWKGGVAISFPRLRPEPGGYTAAFPGGRELPGAGHLRLSDLPAGRARCCSPRARARASATAWPGRNLEDERCQPHHGRRLRPGNRPLRLAIRYQRPPRRRRLLRRLGGQGLAARLQELGCGLPGSDDPPFAP